MGTVALACCCLAAEPAGRDGYAGTEACKECHEKEYAAFIASNHRKYVRVASPESVIGGFTKSNVLEVGGKKTTMLRRGDAFFIRTTGPDGRLHEYRAERTIGHRYKQRYLTTLAAGRASGHHSSTSSSSRARTTPGRA